jgi:peptide/nickel transport system substrate-binding protein
MAVLVACGDRSRDGTSQRPVVVAATGEPESVLPPLVVETVGRDISDLVFERLADLPPGAAPVDTAAYRPRLAAAWERVDPRSWRFHLAKDARWTDGRPVTAEDVVFSFGAFADSALDAPARPYLTGMSATAVDSSTVLIRFAQPYPEQLYDATYHVRVIPRHLWETIPRERWAAETSLARLVGSGPFRITEWRRGQFLRLARTRLGENRREGARLGENRREGARLGENRRRARLGENGREGARSEIGAVVWRFAADPDAAVNLLLSHEADLMELAAAPRAAERVGADSALAVERYPSSAYGFLGFNLTGRDRRSAHPVLDRGTRRALTMAIDRSAVAAATFGPGAAAPPGPMSRLLWIWDDSIATLPFDTAAASKALTAAGWVGRPGQIRRRDGRPLAFDILVPGTSTTRRQIATALQAAWRTVGAETSVTAVDFPVFQERLGRGTFDSYVGAWLDEPSARGLADQWTRAGWDGINYGRYANPAFDTLFRRASAESNVVKAHALYREAMDTLNADAPAIFLYTPTNAAAVSRRLNGVEIDPYSWVSGLPQWTLRGE